MKKIALILLSTLLAAATLQAQAKGAGDPQANISRIYISELFTTHVVFSTDITYADVSNLKSVAVKIVEQNRNILALKARSPFDTKASVTVLESNGVIHTYILEYRQEPEQLVLDTRGEEAQQEYRMDGGNGTAGRDSDGWNTAVPATGAAAAAATQTPAQEKPRSEARHRAGRNAEGQQHVSNLRKRDAPLLKDVIEYPQNLFHISTKDQKLEFTCENIFAYSDITYVVLRLTNKSGVSFEAKDAMFVIEDANRSRRQIKAEPVSLLPKNRFGSLTAAPDQTVKMGYTFEKITLSKDRRLNIYLYEKDGQRTLMLTLTPDDVNLAEQP